MPRLARALYASPRQRVAHSDGGLDLRQLVHQAQAACRFDQLFGQTTDVAALVQQAAQLRGWALPVAAIREEFND